MGRRSRSRSSSGSRSPSPRYVPGFRVHVADLGMEPSKRELEKHFDRFGKIIDIWVAKTPPCFAFVVYQKKEEADKAILGMDGQIVANGRVRVSMARPRTRGRTGASFDPNLRCYQCGEKGHFSRDCNVYLGRFRNINYYTSSSSSRSRSRSRSRDRRSRRRSDSRSRRRSRSRHRSRSRSRHRRSRSRRSRSRDRRKSRSKDRKRNRSKERQRSRSKDRKRSQSKDRKRSRSKDRKRSRSKDRKRSRSKDRKRSRSKDRKRSRSKDRKRSRSNERKRSRSKDEKRSRSNERKRSRSKDRKRSRSNERKRSRSKERKRSRSKDRKRSRSNERKGSRSKDRKRSRSKDRKRSRSKDGKRSRSRSPKKSRDKKSPSRSHKKSQGEEASKTAEKKSIENAKTENASKDNTMEEETTEIKTKPQAEAERPSGKEADIVSGDSADEKHTHEESKGDKPDDADIPVSMSGDQVAQLTVAQTKPSPDSNGVAAGGDGIPTTLSSNGPRDTDTLATDTQLRGDEFANADRLDLHKKPVGDVSTIGSSQAQFTNAAPDHMGDQTTERGDISTKPEPDISSDASLNLTLNIEQRV